ncbi:hypothetical protein [Phaeobacter sp. 22II1-1F12B]|uniref:hypothetical protein n=1 Tax=Phaeobacter sp. 22II1-1F12B TaxID=1317111 RepID=UPI00118542CC|nr:hypothetical protein [Phaeobacter sp. 22II1-1F12B]
MTGYILSSSMTGIFGGALGLLAYGNDLIHVLGWYLIGGWAGLALMVAAVLISNNMRENAFWAVR